jgi:multidrug efflux pump subunit AcrA (membrane-fusion protein)
MTDVHGVPPCLTAPFAVIILRSHSAGKGGQTPPPPAQRKRPGAIIIQGGSVRGCRGLSTRSRFDRGSISLEIAWREPALPASVVELKAESETEMPADAMVFNHNGIEVASVSNGKAEIRKVRVKRDFGTRLEVDTGVKAGDQVILNPPVNLVDGAKVQPRPAAAPDR